MIDERTEAQASLYALDALAPAERREFEAVLRADARLQRLVTELRATASVMTAAYRRVQPPASVKTALLAAIDARASSAARVLTLDPTRPPSWMAWAPWALAACFAILCLVLISLGHTLRQQAISLNEQLEERAGEASDLRQQLESLESQVARQTSNHQERILAVERDAIKRLEELSRQSTALTNQWHQRQTEVLKELVTLRSQAAQLARDKQALEEALAGGSSPARNPNTARITLLRPPDPASRALGAAVWNSQEQRGLLALENLAVLPSHQAYQLWLIDPRFATPISGGVLVPAADASGSVRIQFTPGVRVEAVERMAVSIEPRGGSATPTGKIVLASN